MWFLFAKGLLIGLSIAAPVGPIGVLCIRRTLAQGRGFGIVSGLGAATADAVYGCIAAFGLTVVTGFLTGQQFWFQVIGGLFLCYLGVRTLGSRPAEQAAAERGERYVQAYGSTLLLTLTNPMTILSFAAIFAGLGLSSTEQSGGSSALLIVLGVLLGSACWWFLLCGIVGTVRRRLGSNALLWVNRISGLIVLGFGVASLVGLTAD